MILAFADRFADRVYPGLIVQFFAAFLCHQIAFVQVAEDFDHAVHEGFLRPQNRAMALADTDIGRLLDAMTAYRPEPVSKWLKEERQL